MRLERTTFGPVLRATRERCGISLVELAEGTKVSVELWKDLEDNDFSRWPSRIYARTYIREYALRVGLDPDTVVNEFCRLYPEHGDRRVEGLLRAHAAIVQHDLNWQDDRPATPDQRNRRASDRAVSEAWWLGKHAGRLLGVAIDLGISLGIASIAVLLHLRFWPSLAVAAAAYHAAGVFLTGRTLGMLLSDWSMKTLRLRPVGRRLFSTRAETS